MSCRLFAPQACSQRDVWLFLSNIYSLSHIGSCRPSQPLCSVHFLPLSDLILWTTPSLPSQARFIPMRCCLLLFSDPATCTSLAATTACPARQTTKDKAQIDRHMAWISVNTFRHYQAASFKGYQSKGSRKHLDRPQWHH